MIHSVYRCKRLCGSTRNRQRALYQLGWNLRVGALEIAAMKSAT
jgi:hypothetical protein